jgi:hypothetical protein
METCEILKVIIIGPLAFYAGYKITDLILQDVLRKLEKWY